ncbi:MAG TPA: VWA domain-containing protein, partial [Vicinamibacteria bacterium]|nr:VWA domain-containing protein [Vicinamibacteria bacterium]
MLRPVPLFLLAASISALLTSHAQAQPAPTFPGGVETVRIDAVVLDKEGRPVTGLTAADFEVEENGKKRAISSFEAVVVRSKPAMSPAPSEESEEVVPFVAPRVVAPEDGRAILVFFDDLHVSAPHAEWARSQLASYLSRELRDGDLVGVVSPGTHAWWFAATPVERERLPLVLRGFQGRLLRRDERPLIGVVGSGRDAQINLHQPPLTPWEAMRIAEGYDEGDRVRAGMIYAVEQRDIGMTLGSLGQALQALARLPGRKTVLFVSEGFILMPKRRSEQYEGVIELARRANVV